MQDLVASAVYDVDATLAASYDGASQTWSNIIAAPADGSAQTAYDKQLGSAGSAGADDPTFVGTAGSPSAYFVVDGGDYFINKATATDFIKGLHKTTGGSDFWYALAFRFAQNDALQVLSATAGATNVPGLVISSNGSENLALSQRGDTASVTNSFVGPLVNGTSYLVIYSHSHSTNQTRRWVNSITKNEATQTFNTTTTDATGLSLAAETDGGNKCSNGFRFYAESAGNTYIDDAQAALIFSEYERRHQRDYTP